MKIAQLCYSDSAGGAMRAAYRIHQAINRDDTNSTLFVKHKGMKDKTVAVIPTRHWETRLKKHIKKFTNLCLKTENSVLHSYALIPSNLPRMLNKSDFELVHLHWINEEMLSIKDIDRINRPLVWTMHDMWAICGGEHLTFDFRWRDGYSRHNRPAYESGLDLNRWTWRRKRKNWSRPIHMVTPSQWLASCVRESALMSAWPVSVIPNPIDTDFWRPINKTSVRKQLNLPEDVALLLFGSLYANSKPHKGFDLLLDALSVLQNGNQKIELIVLGDVPIILSENCALKIHNVPRTNNDEIIRALYNAVDVVVVPSRMESFGQFASEALSCGTPVVAFGVTGLLDVVRHKKSGYLAEAFDPEDLAHGIDWVLSDSNRYDKLCFSARHDAETRFSYPVVGKQYKELYKFILR